MFEKLPSKYLGKLDKFKAVSKVKTNIYNTPIVYAKSGDNGIMYWAKENDFTVYRNILSIIYNGAIATGLVYAQPQNTGILAESYFIRLKEYDVDFKVNLFLQRVLETILYPKYSREYLATWSGKVENDKIQLPLKNKKIDFEFMESFIAQIEAERIEKLEAYLEASGLKDYVLTVEEQKALDDFGNIEFEEFNVIDIFDVKNAGNILSRDIIKNSGKTPYLCASSENNGISSYISYNEEYLDEGNCIFIGGKTFVVSYQEKDFYSNDSHNLALYLRNQEKSKLNQLYLATCVNKGLGYKYSWGDSISNRKIQRDTISLPTENQQPNYKIMETLISAIQKLVIKDVVLYVDIDNSTP